MDGNGRWAQRRRHPRVYGHIRGSSRVKPIVREADRLGIKALTLYAFSTENWTRPESELGVLWRLLKKYLVREIDELDRQNVRLHVIGETERLAPDVRAELDPAIEQARGQHGLAAHLRGFVRLAARSSRALPGSLPRTVWPASASPRTCPRS